MGAAAGESGSGDLRVDFDRRLKLEFHGSRVTSDSRIASAATPKPAKARCRILAARLPRDSDPDRAQKPFHDTKDRANKSSDAPQRARIWETPTENIEN